MGDLPTLRAIVRQAQAYNVLDITRHTAAAYAELKTNLAKKYLAKASRRDRPRWLEDWVDKATGQKLQIDENDLWMCAQAKERDLVFVTADARTQRIADADPDVRVLVVWCDVAPSIQAVYACVKLLNKVMLTEGGGVRLNKAA